ncbi:helix-hairpin-helix domain-containing protein [Laspinema olomoucense]|uniref:Helix-hairpin-helix domain-containing protein n=1 Tax=Laspinema olomoucense D3b TaxID=2953688 RepID=A0ABT2NA48_9CYAN|nr:MULTISPECIES: helix-hairpin-helix domain-containing protein [unclassified Laspinema]MCT7970708.1 helix-hairpin-helix domain-containing protein [Laspinema sp. D3d]MCT7979557.1 helix-hairpin-helix domain-containing protein [Laspinema sp. D3b]MCT7987712.1 helix-hairpin-helix domain-containing protein [Laspinema sp. D3a]MCT7996522.1 helix-hairpin-helix domain-containing protein [Laspinema sp. D3c]
MSKDPLSLERTPNWVWYSMIPGLGGLAIAYAGKKTNTTSWIVIGLGMTGFTLFLAETSLMFPIWVAQIGLAWYFKKGFLDKMSSPELTVQANFNGSTSISKKKVKIDINKCSKNDLVQELNLPIVYANDIEALRNEGYIFTDPEELSDMVGIPETTVQRIANFIVFGYDYKQESDFSWRRLNSYSLEELMTVGLQKEVAQKIVNERKRGEYKSVIDVKRRTQLPLATYRQII